MQELIEQKLVQAFAPTELLVEDDSEAHRGHGGFREGGGTHFNVTIKAAAFVGLSRVARQRLVNKELAIAFDQGLHALSLKVDIPET